MLSPVDKYYSESCVLRPLWWDHLSYKTTLAGTWTYINIEIYTCIPVIKDHPSYKTTNGNLIRAAWMSGICINHSTTLSSSMICEGSWNLLIIKFLFFPCPSMLTTGIIFIASLILSALFYSNKHDKSDIIWQMSKMISSTCGISICFLTYIGHCYPCEMSLGQQLIPQVTFWSHKATMTQSHNTNLSLLRSFADLGESFITLGLTCISTCHVRSHI